MPTMASSDLLPMIAPHLLKSTSIQVHTQNCHFQLDETKFIGAQVVKCKYPFVCVSPRRHQLMPSLLIRHLILLPHNYPFKPLRKENVTVFLAKNMLFAKNISISLLNSGSQLDPAQLNPSFSHVL